MKQLTTALALISILFFQSCDDSTSTAPAPPDYYDGGNQGDRTMKAHNQPFQDSRIDTSAMDSAIRLFIINNISKT